MRPVTALIITLLMAFPAASRPLTTSEQDKLESALATFTRAIQTKRMRRIVAVLPPKVLAEIAISMQTTPQEMRRALIREMRTDLKVVRFSHMEVRTNDLDAQDATASDGSAVTYTFVPMHFRMHLKPNSFSNSKITSSTLALREDGQWYFMQIDDETHKAVLTKVYPFLKDVRFPVRRVLLY